MWTKYPMSRDISSRRRDLERKYLGYLGPETARQRIRGCCIVGPQAQIEERIVLAGSCRLAMAT